MFMRLPVCVPRVATIPRNMAAGQSVLPIATRHLTLGVADAECGQTEPGGRGRRQRRDRQQWTETARATVDRDAVGVIVGVTQRRLVSKLSFLTVKMSPKIHLALNESLPWLAAGAFLLWWTDEYSHKCLVDARKEM